MTRCLWDKLPAELQDSVRKWVPILEFRDRIKTLENKLTFPKEIHAFHHDGDYFYVSFSYTVYNPFGTLYWRISFVDGLLNAYHFSLAKCDEIVHRWWCDYNVYEDEDVVVTEVAVSSPFGAI